MMSDFVRYVGVDSVTSEGLAVVNHYVGAFLCTATIAASQTIAVTCATAANLKCTATIAASQTIAVTCDTAANLKSEVTPASGAKFTVEQNDETKLKVTAYFPEDVAMIVTQPVASALLCTASIAASQTIAVTCAVAANLLCTATIATGQTIKVTCDTATNLKAEVAPAAGAVFTVNVDNFDEAIIEATLSAADSANLERTANILNGKHGTPIVAVVQISPSASDVIRTVTAGKTLYISSLSVVVRRHSTDNTYYRIFVQPGAHTGGYILVEGYVTSATEHSVDRINLVFPYPIAVPATYDVWSPGSDVYGLIVLVGWEE